MKPLDEIVLPSKLGHVDQQQIRVNFHDCHEIKSPLSRWKYAFELRTMMIESSLPSSSFPPPLSDYHRSTFVYPSLPLSPYFPPFFPLEETLEDTYQTTNPRDFPYYTPSPLRENKRDSS